MCSLPGIMPHHCTCVVMPCAPLLWSSYIRRQSRRARLRLYADERQHFALDVVTQVGEVGEVAIARAVGRLDGLGLAVHEQRDGLAVAFLDAAGPREVAGGE